MREERIEKNNIIRMLMPLDYRLWASTSQTIFDVYETLNIVLGNESCLQETSESDCEQAIAT